MLSETRTLSERRSPLRDSTILAVDDEPDALHLLDEVFSGQGFRTMHASSGAEAISVIDEKQPDLLIVDYMMAGMNGLELCEYLRERNDTRRIPIILYSAYTMRHSDCWLYERAFMKPADPDELVSAARELLSRPS
jgi:CheY-like chemotaxis protein